MRTIRMSLSDEQAGRPSGNPFPVKGIEWVSEGNRINVIKTGVNLLGFGSHDDLVLSATSLIKGMAVMSTYLDGDEVCLLVWMSADATYGGDDHLAKVMILKSESETVRFVEEKDGKRVIVGGPETVDG